MTTFSFEVEYPAAPQAVFDAFWSLEDWPQVAQHVTGIEMLFEDRNVQVLRMHVRTGSRRDAFKTVRLRQGLSIFYVQPAPPPALRRHSGWWHVVAAGDGTRVTSEHAFEIEPKGARRFLDSIGWQGTSEASTETGVREVLHHNSRQTMLALRDRLLRAEQGSASQEAHHATA